MVQKSELSKFLMPESNFEQYLCERQDEFPIHHPQGTICPLSTVVNSDDIWTRTFLLKQCSESLLLFFLL